jgi:hypothetical protein
MFCFECARSVPIDAPRDDIGLLKQTPPKPIPTTIWKRARSQEMHVSVSNQSLSAPSCNCAFALTSLTKYTMKLLSMSVPEMLRSLENQNTENISCNQHFHIVPHTLCAKLNTLDCVHALFQHALIQIHAQKPHCAKFA